MNLQYNCGQPMPPQTSDAILFTAKTGVMTANIWRQYFSQGTAHSKRRSLRRLCERGYFRPHGKKIAQDMFGIGPMGTQWLNRQGYAYAAPPPFAQLEHDVILAEAALKMESECQCDQWRTEAELRVAGGRAYSMPTGGRYRKYPDLLLSVGGRLNPMKVAIELEITQKSTARYRDIISAYEGMMDLTEIIFVTQTEAIQDAIDRNLRSHASTRLRTRVVLILLEAWRKNPGVVLGMSYAKANERPKVERNAAAI